MSVSLPPLSILMGAGAAMIAIAGSAYYLTCSPRSGLFRVKIASVDDLGIGKMKEITAKGPDGKPVVILLIRTSLQRFRATAGKCTHANVSLANGVLCGDRVVCPAHAACFNVDTGDIEDG